MYCPPAFRVEELASLHGLMRAARLANVVTFGANGLHASPLPLFLDETEGPFGTLYGHFARANAQWKDTPLSDALAIFMGPDAYVSPSWYASKKEHGKVVPTWNYSAVHARGPIEFFDDEARLRDVVERLTNLHEAERPEVWSVSDAPAPFLRGQLRGIIGLRLPITGLEGKNKMSQNRSAADRAGVAEGMAGSSHASERAVAGKIPVE
ncbi:MULTISPECIES: FMN-binding negative transcriptional regulator [Nitratireductor]|uniref:FMN-binding negative transcriptional regulator n=1 Tax=Nitratireductor TaxID=245876 RepID=UPI0019D38856|nr:MULTISPECIES: FMN-binding negative transcriptional regulator [Nitratireductor]MBN7775967.1 FMN-binding negative transcriptional regulator [Nitratireductor pacificus]MBN7780631.1 FMN-binding negative transcriptional regulator [Nitratireductor pacificus]MBN7789437.1 FMN-binding negative transcriptional regulator [Nitratireductor aquimarinus]MBY6098715.1 FMN-binding negative transcriptional regulator [Nitratireductor aquimarinus]MCA1259602.1 FMN-binding negative transcriptional regulator [Nitr